MEQLGDDALIERLTNSVRGDRKLTVRMLVEMGELDARVLFRELGFPSKARASGTADVANSEPRGRSQEDVWY